MAANLSLDALPDWALPVGAGAVAGGAYLLYKRRKAAGAGAPASTTPAPVTSYGADSQQSGVVPYYLTGTSNRTGPNPPARGTPLPVPVGVPGGAEAAPNFPTFPLSPEAAPVTPPPAAAPVTQPAAPAPSQELAPDLLARIQAGGENIIGSLRSPNGGTWYLGSYGGVFNAGGAPFFGSARNYNFGPQTGRLASQIVPFGSGYRVISNRNENYDFPAG